MRTLFILVLLILTTEMLSAQTDDAPQVSKFEWIGVVGLGTLLGGNRDKAITETLTPTPTELRETSIGTELRWYFFENFGLDTRGTLGLTSANASGQTSMAVFYRGSIALGPRFRLVYPVTNTSSLSLYAGAGISENWTSYSYQYSSLVPPGYYLYDLLPGIGYYAKVGVQFVPVKPFFFGGEVGYEHIGGEVAESHHDFSGELIALNLFGGLWF